MTDFTVAVASVVKNEDGEILMVQEGKEHVRGKWDFPGGEMEDSETIEEATEREVLEETGFKTDLQKLIGIYFGKSQRTGQPSIDFLAESKIIGKGKKNPDFDDEILKEKFFSVDKVEKLDLRKENRERMIKDYRECREIDLNSIGYIPEFK